MTPLQLGHRIKSEMELKNKINVFPNSCLKVILVFMYIKLVMCKAV